MNMLERAIQIAVDAHAGQKDKSGKPYVLHPLRVMLRMETEQEMIVAVLHDVVEDTECTLGELDGAGLLPSFLVASIDAITHREDETYNEYIERVSWNPLATRVKLADLEDNMSLERTVGLSDKECISLYQRHLKAWKFLKGVNHDQD